VARDGLSFSDASSAAIAVLKNSAKRSHTLMYCSRYCGVFCLTLTTLMAPERFSLLVWIDVWCRFTGIHINIAIAALKTTAGRPGKCAALIRDPAMVEDFALLSGGWWRQKASGNPFYWLGFHEHSTLL
jgi:hypothetical protein